MIIRTAEQRVVVEDTGESVLLSISENNTALIQIGILYGIQLPSNLEVIDGGQF